MTEIGSTDLDMNSKELIINETSLQFVMIGKNGTWVRWHDGQRVLVNPSAQITVLRPGRSALVARGYDEGSMRTQRVNAGLLALLFSGLALISVKIARWSQ